MADTAPSPAALLTAFPVKGLDEEIHALVNTPDSTCGPVLEMSETAAGFSKCRRERPARAAEERSSPSRRVTVAAVAPAACFWQARVVVPAPSRPTETTPREPEGRARVQADQPRPSLEQRPTTRWGSGGERY